jgi:serine phosphatase RsbU (regulator of sigma subunit)
MVRPLAPQLPLLPAPSVRVRIRRFLLGTWRGRILLGALAAWLLDLLLGLAGFEPPLLGLARPILILYALWGAWRALRWLSARFLWRIRTKLILSYLFVALVPVVLLSLFLALAAVAFMMLVVSRTVVEDIERTGEILLASARGALADLPEGDAQARAALPRRLAPTRALHPDLAWTLLDDGRVVAASGTPHTLPPWWDGRPFEGLVQEKPESGEGTIDVVRALWPAGTRVLILDIPADERFFAELGRRNGLRVIPVRGRQTPPGLAEEASETLGAEPEGSGSGQGGGGGAAFSGLGAFAFPEWTRWATGETSVFPALTVLYQPLEIVRRLSPGLLPREAGAQTLPDILLLAMGSVGFIFLVMYAVALTLGLVLARSITRGVHELSVGTQRLREGDFTHSIPIRSRDQLGDLAESFNLMSRGIQDLMREQAEKERLEEELRIAREIQMSLLPGTALSTVPGVRVSALCIPATEVGGDYYDVLPLSETRMGVLVADVSGKGTSAALYMAELKGLVLSLARIHESPARLLVEANRILAESTDSRTFVTMTYAVVDAGARCMRFARAGHNPLIQLEARTGKTRVLTPPGMGLGLDRGEAFESVLREEEIPLAPGDIFLFFTDGLSEAMNESSELFGEVRLREILEGSDGLGSDQLKARILEEVERFVGDAAPHDDLTMVVLKVVPESA